MKELQRTSCTLLFLFAFHAGFSQQVEWELSIGGSEDDEAYALSEVRNGSFVVLGESKSEDGDLPKNHGKGLCKSYDVWAVKVQNGQVKWKRNFGGENDDHGNAIARSDDGGFLLVCSTTSKGGDVSNRKGGGLFKDEDLWLIKIDAEGEIQWERTYGGSKDDEGHSIISAENGGYVILGNSESSDGDLVDDRNEVSGNSADLWILKVDGNGDIEWDHRYGGSEDESGNAIQRTRDGGFIAVGKSGSSDGDVSENQDDKSFFTAKGDFWAVKLDSNGGIQWERSYGGSAKETAQSVLETRNGSFVVLGVTYSQDGDVGLTYSQNGDVKNDVYGSRFWWVKLGRDGSMQWQKVYGNSLSHSGYSIKEGVGENFLIGGFTGGSMDGSVSNWHGGGDAYVLSCDRKGNVVWERAFGGSEMEDLYQIERAKDGFVFVGRTGSKDGDVSGNKGKRDMWIVKVQRPNDPKDPEDQ